MVILLQLWRLDLTQIQSMTSIVICHYYFCVTAVLLEIDLKCQTYILVQLFISIKKYFLLYVVSLFKGILFNFDKSRKKYG